MARKEFYTLTEAAQVLGITQRRLLEMLAAKEIEGEQDSQSSRWKISKHAVHELIPELLPTDQPRVDHEDTAELPAETVQDLIGELDNLQREMERLKRRLELAQQAQNSAWQRESSAWQEERELLLDELEREREERRRERERAESTLRAERDRLLEDQRREQERAAALQEEANSLREKLEIERSKGSWRRRLFGR